MRKVILVEPIQSGYANDFLVTDSWDSAVGPTVIRNVPTGFSETKKNRLKKKKRHKKGRYSPPC